MVRNATPNAKSMPVPSDARIYLVGSDCTKRGLLIMDLESPAESSETVEESIGHSGDWIRLDKIQPGHCGLVSSVLAGEAEIERLKSMGVCVGRRLMMVRAGDPMIVKVLGSRIGISARLAERVQVLPCGGDAFGDA